MSYPGNCTRAHLGSRNCPAVITSGDLKLVLGAIGHEERLELDESTGGKSVPFGKSGGYCGLAGFDDRCESPGMHITGDTSGCLNGCLFNISGDVSESVNLYNDSAYAADVQRLTARLQEAGASAPAWFQAPEVNKISDADLAAALCKAAEQAGGVQ